MCEAFSCLPFDFFPKNYYIFYIKKTQNKTKKTFVYKKNEEIFAREVRVVDETGKNIGVLPTKEAIRLAADKGLDLIEIASAVTPPIVKIESYDKFRYQKEKEFKRQQQAQTKTKELKQIKIGLQSARNDLLIRVRQIEEFLTEGHKVEIVMRLRGREKANKDYAAKKMEEFLTLIGLNYKVTSAIKPAGNGLSVQIDKNDK